MNASNSQKMIVALLVGAVLVLAYFLYQERQEEKSSITLSTPGGDTVLSITGEKQE